MPERRCGLRLGMAAVCLFGGAHLQAVRADDDPRTVIVTDVEQKMRRGLPKSLTPGQLYFLIEGFHAAYSRETPPPAFLYELAERAWSLHIYHLQLATMDRELRMRVTRR